MAVVVAVVVSGVVNLNDNLLCRSSLVRRSPTHPLPIVAGLAYVLRVPISHG